MSRSSKNSFLHFFEFIIILLMITAITFFVLNIINPVKVQETINMATEKIKFATDTIQEAFTGKKLVEDNLEFPEEEDLTGAQRYFYYQQLSDTGKKIYVTIENNIENLKNGVDNIPLPPSLDEDAKRNENGKEYIVEEFQNAWDAFVTDKSEYFYIDSSKVCLVTKMTVRGSNTNYEFFIGKGNNPSYLIDEFNNQEEVNSAIEKLENAKNEILKNAEGNNYNKMKYIHNWIIDNVKYDTENSENISNIYGCLVNKSVVCEGYARAFKYLLDELKIPCILVSGIATDSNGASERHAWNYVYIKNAWYAIDTTWDDPIIIGSGKVDEKVKYKYFLRGSKTMNQDHNSIGQITKNGHEFDYPELSVDDIK